MDSEGENLFALITKDVDPHQVCNVIDVCPTTTAFENVSLKIFDGLLFLNYIRLV